MLRGLVVALLAANLLVFAWMSGGLGFLEPVLPFLAERPDAQREPDRLARQIQPERLRLIPQEAPMPESRPASAAGISPSPTP